MEIGDQPGCYLDRRGRVSECFEMLLLNYTLYQVGGERGGAFLTQDDATMTQHLIW